MAAMKQRNANAIMAVKVMMICIKSSAILAPVAAPKELTLAEVKREVNSDSLMVKASNPASSNTRIQSRVNIPLHRRAVQSGPVTQRHCVAGY
ncbi:hypothetical protein RRG08_002781 [Elysia crispata]|uniref:Uncharacterized protein n=1 Tax=Elysia crispata TaxID=231223 RepID=A0AAE1CM30_9GAST|nr:hypothetical protein RRG08_002781 [Elysia crispata]